MTCADPSYTVTFTLKTNWLSIHVHDDCHLIIRSSDGTRVKLDIRASNYLKYTCILHTAYACTSISYDAIVFTAHIWHCPLELPGHAWPSSCPLLAGQPLSDLRIRISLRNHLDMYSLPVLRCRMHAPSDLECLLAAPFVTSPPSLPCTLLRFADLGASRACMLPSRNQE